MTETSSFDEPVAHKFFSATCFNRAWGLIDKADRTPEEAETLIHLCHASLWHWSCRPDCTDQNRSIGYWQLSRVYAILGQADNARHYAKRCLEASKQESPFFLGYAYEALSRSEKVAGNSEQAADYLKQAFAQAELVEAEEDRNMLLDDLNSLS
ncbi:MAG: hypothetical protein R3C11_14725 [Planctomycetaceae bacterium]